MPELRDLPAIDSLLAAPELAMLVQQVGIQTVRDEIRTIQQRIREERDVPQWATTASGYADALVDQLINSDYTPVFNLTGTILHTNLGRALLSETMWQRIAPLVTRPMNLEFDLRTGRRGDRDQIIEQRLCRLTGCEAATVVNNNAAALALVLNTFALGANVPVSRGELIEIGGSFRLPELMQQAGCTLLEVGTTNRTHLRDFRNVIEQAAMVLKVHPSNYFIGGFSAEVSAAELAQLASEHDIPSCVDLGSGTLVDLTRWGLPPEPTPSSVLQDGIDLVTFSGDKLLGGPQAGIIVGRQDLVAQIKRNPLKRAMRADKITLAVLNETLKLYEQPLELPRHLPLLDMLTTDIETLRARAQTISDAMPPGWQTTIKPGEAQIGSGALPDKTIPSICLAVHHPEHSTQQIAEHFRRLPTPVIGRIADDEFLLDMRGAVPADALCANALHLS